MEQLKIDLGPDSYLIHIDGGLLANLRYYLGSADRWVAITDQEVDALYGHAVSRACRDGEEITKIVIPPGEASKNLQTVERILEQMSDLGLTRHSAVLALGGGVVGDVAGFCASIYMRGIPYVQAPTTLLAQVDSSVGGKTGVNMPWGKNTIGTFHQPRAVIIDTQTLRTLPKRQLISGLAEVIKYGVIYDYDFLTYLNSHFAHLLNLGEEAIERVVKRCCEIKAEVVAKDEKEAGLRKILNCGHTVGHALEAATAYQKYTHGEAVLIGLSYEVRMAKELGHIDQAYCHEIIALLRKTGVDLELTEALLGSLVDYMLRDKKNRDGRISFVLPKGKGTAAEVLLTRAEAASVIRKLV